MKNVLSVDVVKLGTTRLFTRDNGTEISSSSTRLAINFYFSPVFLHFFDFTADETEPKRKIFLCFSCLVDGDKVVRFQARRETELKLSWKCEKKLWEWWLLFAMMRVCSGRTQGRIGKVSSGRMRNREKIFSAERSEWKSWKRKKCYVWVEEFSLRFSGTFLMTKAPRITLRSRILRRDSADSSQNWSRAPLDTNSAMQFALFFFLLVSLAQATHNFDFLAKLLHEKIFQRDKNTR